jgi:Pyruvate/2-oxoacid:ferredoxin oxidoreductase delta subunit
MVIQINQELCAGCGVCVDECLVGAIHLVDQRAVIDDALCTHCEACADVCPNEAITALSIPAYSMPIAALPAAESRIVPGQSQVALQETTSSDRGIVPLVGAALAFLGREAAPRLVDVLVTVLERRLARLTTTTVDPVSTFSQIHIARDRGERRQACYRSRRSGYRNHNGRR